MHLVKWPQFFDSSIGLEILTDYLGYHEPRLRVSLSRAFRHALWAFSVAFWLRQEREVHGVRHFALVEKSVNTNSLESKKDLKTNVML